MTLVIPIALGTIARDLLANPAKCVEEIIRLPFGEGRVVNVIIYAVFTAISPLTALVDAVFSVAIFLWRPYNTSRINSLSNFKELLHAEQLIETKTDACCNVKDDIKPLPKLIANKMFIDELDKLLLALPTDLPRESATRNEILDQMDKFDPSAEFQEEFRTKMEAARDKEPLRAHSFAERLEEFVNLSNQLNR